MASRKAKKQNSSGLYIALIACLTLAVFTGYITIFAPESGPLNSVYVFLHKLGGMMAVLFPAMLLYSFVQCVRRALGYRVKTMTVVCDLLIFYTVFAMTEVFFYTDVVNIKGVPLGWFDFINKAYECSFGGGAVGALVAGLLCARLKTWLAFSLLFIIAVILLGLTGRIGRLVAYLSEHSSAPATKKETEPAPRASAGRADTSRPRKIEFQNVQAPKRGKPKTARASERAEATNDPMPVIEITDEDLDAALAKEDASPKKKSHVGKKPRVSEDDLPRQETVFDLEDDEIFEKKVEKKPEKKAEKKAEKKEDKPFTPEKLKRTAPSGDEDGYCYPPLDMLREGHEAVVDDSATDRANAKRLEETLRQFNIETTLTGVAHGPTVTRYELRPAPGTRVSKITSIEKDIALNLAAKTIRIEAPIPGKAAVGIEIPNKKTETVYLRDVLESDSLRNHKSKLAVALGKDNAGQYIACDLARMPHLLIAGATGSGKSVCINSIIISLLYRTSPDDVRLILIDPKIVELGIYNGIPHLIAPVVTDPKKAQSALEWAALEMDERYTKFEKKNVRNLAGYNASLEDGEEKIPSLVIIIDELSDLMMQAAREVENAIVRLTQKARAAGIYLIIATQRPSVDVVTGLIKANVPSRIAFTVASQVDSRTILDHAGAEKLLGRGDMLYAPTDSMQSTRIQGAWVSDAEVERIVNYVKSNSEVDYNEDAIEKIETAAMNDVEKEQMKGDYDEKLPEAIEIALETGQISTSMLQRRMRIGYARAGRLMDEMYMRGIVSEADGSKPRRVLMTREQVDSLFED